MCYCRRVPLLLLDFARAPLTRSCNALTEADVSIHKVSLPELACKPPDAGQGLLKQTKNLENRGSKCDRQGVVE